MENPLYQTGADRTGDQFMQQYAEVASLYLCSDEMSWQRGQILRIKLAAGKRPRYTHASIAFILLLISSSLPPFFSFSNAAG